MLLQVIAFKRVLTVILMKTTILVSGPLIRISFQLARPHLGCVVLDLHRDLIDWGSQQGEVGEPSSGGFGASILLSVSEFGCLPSLVLPCILLPFPLLGFLLSG